MKIIAITGAIASGKNLVAKIFEKFGAVIFDADKEVHDLLKTDLSVIRNISQAFPQSLQNNQISRQILGKLVFADKENVKKNLKILEQIIHPEVRKKCQNFIEKNRQNEQKILVLNIPLLLENKGQGMDYEYDYLVAIKCDKKIRKQRFIQRYKNNFGSESENFDHEKIVNRFEEITQLQIDDNSRFDQADCVIDNNSNIDFTEQQISHFLSKIFPFK